MDMDSYRQDLIISVSRHAQDVISRGEEEIDLMFAEEQFNDPELRVSMRGFADRLKGSLRRWVSEAEQAGTRNINSNW